MARRVPPTRASLRRAKLNMKPNGGKKRAKKGAKKSKGK